MLFISIVNLPVSIALSFTNIVPLLSFIVPVCLPVGLEPIHVMTDATVSATYLSDAGVTGFGASASVIVASGVVLSFLHEVARIMVITATKSCFFIGLEFGITYTISKI